MSTEDDLTTARNPRAEAAALLADGYVGRVHEPSPPAVDDGEFYADDPLNTDVGSGVLVASVGGDLSWADYAAEHPEAADWAAERWLVPRRLPPLPAGLVASRIALHRLATYVVAPARHQANGKFGLRWTKGGFGTPFFGPDVQVRVEGGRIVVQEGAEVRSAPISTLRSAAELIGSRIDSEVAAEHDTPPMGDVDAPLDIDPTVADFLGEWWGFGVAALERVRADAASVDPARVQIWPGHFDPAIEVGDEDHRASYGASPGDDGSDEPYLYVAAWWPDRLALDEDDPFWNADGYTGARLPFSAVADADDPVAVAVDFFRAGRDRMAAA